MGDGRWEGGGGLLSIYSYIQNSHSAAQFKKWHWTLGATFQLELSSIWNRKDSRASRLLDKKFTAQRHWHVEPLPEFPRAKSWQYRGFERFFESRYLGWNSHRIEKARAEVNTPNVFRFSCEGMWESKCMMETYGDNILANTRIIFNPCLHNFDIIIPTSCSPWWFPVGDVV